MVHDATNSVPLQAAPALAARMHRQLVQFLHPFAAPLADQLDIRLVQTFVDLVQVIITFRHRHLGLLLSELGGYLLGPAHAPAGTKRISNLIHAPDWQSADLQAVLWQQAQTRVQQLHDAGEEVLLVWDGSVLEKPESPAGPDWCPVRSSKAARLRRFRKHFTRPPSGPPVTVPGLHWLGLVVLGQHGPPTLAQQRWWTTRGPQATDQRTVEAELVEQCAARWGRTVWHIWDRDWGNSPWIQRVLALDLRFITRWKKRNKLLDNWGEARKAWEIARGKRSQSYRWLRDQRTKQLIKVGVVAIPVTLQDHPQPLWLVVARQGQGREPWYLVTAEPLRTVEDIWRVVLAYARRWQIEQVWRFSKSELAFESPRVEAWEDRQKLLLLATVAYAFLLHLLDGAYTELRALLLRWWCHRTGRRARATKQPLYRLRAALSRLWQTRPPPGRHPIQC